MSSRNSCAASRPGTITHAANTVHIIHVHLHQNIHCSLPSHQTSFYSQCLRGTAVRPAGRECRARWQRTHCESGVSYSSKLIVWLFSLAHSLWIRWLFLQLCFFFTGFFFPRCCLRSIRNGIWTSLLIFFFLFYVNSISWLSSSVCMLCLLLLFCFLLLCVLVCLCAWLVCCACVFVCCCACVFVFLCVCFVGSCCGFFLFFFSFLSFNTYCRRVTRSPFRFMTPTRSLKAGPTARVFRAWAGEFILI